MAGRPSVRSFALVAAVVLWGGGIAAGFIYGTLYEQTPSKSDTAQDHWPPASRCRLATDKPTLLMFVHPRCPCSRASISELSVLMTHCHDRLESHVLFLGPTSTPDDWAKTDLWKAAARIPGVELHLDIGGVEHRRFGALVSGEVFLYQPSGELAFHGGITAGRGHAGDNLGRWALEQFLLKDELPTAESPVFGCELTTPASCCSPTTEATTVASP